VTFFADFTSGQSNVSYTRMRQLLATSGGGLQEGVIGAGDLKVSQRALGANPSVDVAVGDAWVQYDTGTRNGLSHVWSDAVANVAINASDATNPRIDQIGVQLNDVGVGAGTGGNTPALRYVPGTATPGATLDNRTGAAAAPNDWMRLADFLVPAGTNSPVTTANIRDRRPWARGAYNRIALTSGNKTTASVSLVEIDTVNLKPRIECSGNPVRLRLVGVAQHSTTSFIQGTFFMDGAAIDSTGAIAAYPFVTGQTGASLGLQWDYVAVPPAGSHLFSPAWVTGSATATLLATAGNPLVLTIEEIVRPNASNT
jgi:hypothetical protein